MRQKVRFETTKDVQKFVEVVSRAECKVELEDNHGHRVSAFSILGALYSLEWDEIYCCCQQDIYAYIFPWVI